ncbi:MAG: hypothetical protein A3J52_01225 [Omnitrophica bacterium RIFCSPHIGHO2_02_FULL_49_9]|nr:MAG: hypothetical protein A3J52_01225 [Omnitrophica bacterium RIFCSPHIGHO2_02_FULL_49_9]OGW90144.1 MAG: hypothetical protein A3A73_01745 [Omnitrophica bacterium RIFCSPLOWO2_01_FULL_50_24]
MKILDRYLTKQLCFPILFCLATLIFLVFMSDLFNHLDEMLKNRTPILLILKYYTAMLPETFVSTISWASLLGVVYVLTAFNYHNETTAMKIAGLEITAIIRPIIFIGFLLGVVTFLIDDQIVPRSTQVAVRILTEHIQKNSTEKEGKGIFENVTHYGDKNRLYYARIYNDRKANIQDFVILWLDQGKKVKKKTVAQHAQWTGAIWELHRVTEYAMEKSGMILGEPTYRETVVYPEITEGPDQFRRAGSIGFAISYRDLKEHVKTLRESGVKLSSELVSLHYKLASPWHSLIVMLLVVPFLAKTSTRRMIAFNVLVCLCFIFLFHVSGAVILAMGKAAKLFPLASAWAQSFIFGFGTLFFLDRANY